MVKSNAENTIIKFWGNGCMNCKALAPILEGVKLKHPNINFREININANSDDAQKYNITTIPTLVFEKDGQTTATLAGLKPASLIEKKIMEVF